MQRNFVVAEVALSVALVCATGVLAEAAHRAARAERSIIASPDVVVADLDLTLRTLPAARVDQLLDAATARIAALPGVQAVSFANAQPGTGFGSNARLRLAGDSAASAAENRAITVVRTGDGLFNALGLPMTAGREFGRGDRAGSAPVAVIDELLAATRWPGENVIGRTVSFESWQYDRDTAVVAFATVVGVVPTVWTPDGSRTVPTIYVPAAQRLDSTSAYIFVRSTAASAEDLLPVVRRELRLAAAELPVRNVLTLEQDFRMRAAEPLRARLLSLLAGGVALIIACMGLYAVISFALAHRTREIGIRRALGADDRDVVYTFFHEGMGLVLAGLGIGVPLGIAAMKIETAAKFGVQRLDVSTVAGIVALLLVVCALAIWLPARKAAVVNPLDALRQD
jgi:hypothetical protein